MNGTTRRGLLKLAGGVLVAGTGLYRVPGVAQSPQFRDADRTKDRIVAVVRAFEQGYAKPLPDIQEIKPIPDVAIAGVQARPDELPLIDYFVGDLQLRYSFDNPRYFSSVSAADLTRLKLKREELLPLAIANFRRRYPNFQVERMPAGLSSVTNAGEIEPSLMLDAGFWDLERQRAASEVIAAVPARDTLVFANRSVTGYVDMLRRVVADVYGAAGESALSRKLFLWTNRRWQVLA
jgi:uncharacterized protein YtpQ (UPF0354 family)